MTKDTKDNAVDLLPCPFCGVMPEIDHYGEGYKVSIDCMNFDCDIAPQLTQTRRDIPSAIKSWNTRTPSLETIIARIEAEKLAPRHYAVGGTPEYNRKVSDTNNGLDKAISIIREEWGK